MEPQISSLGALAGLLLAIVLILRKVHPVYSLMMGSLAGGLLGGNDPVTTVNCMIAGAGEMMQAVLRILAAGVLVGVMIQTGAANVIAKTLVARAGERWILPALAAASMILTISGIIMDVAVITVAPIALAAGARLNLSRVAILLAMTGGAKAGNLISLNPNTIILSETMNVPLMKLMLAGVVPALGGFAMACVLASLLRKGRERIEEEGAGASGQSDHATSLAEGDVGFFAALSSPALAMLLLASRSVTGIPIDPLIALPFGGLAGLCVMRRTRDMTASLQLGMTKMASVSLLMVGTGCLAGIIESSCLRDSLVNFMGSAGLPGFTLAPLSGILLGCVTASPIAGVTIASSVFGTTLVGMGVPPLASAVMIHSGAMTFDTLPHGSFFHTSASAVQMELGRRMVLIPCEMLVGLTETALAVLMFMPRQ
ncbi:MAG: SLC13 family permease [Planctomycetia bacterium]|nr:SLC13 family permease [Planctomycetia bacterium]